MDFRFRSDQNKNVKFGKSWIGNQMSFNWFGFGQGWILQNFIFKFKVNLKQGKDFVVMCNMEFVDEKEEFYLYRLWYK